MARERPLTERQEAVLLVLLRERDELHACRRSRYPMTGNEIGASLDLPDVRRQRGPWAGRMGPAQRVIGTLNGLRNARGLVGVTTRRDDRSGTAYMLTEEGLKVARELRAARTEGVRDGGA